MRKTIYEFTIYICIIPEIAWEKCKNRQGRWVEYVYIKLGVTDVGRLPERMEEIPGTISKYCIPLIAVTIRLEIEHKEYEPIPTWESTRKAYEEELRRRMWNSCFTDDVFQRNRETGGEEWGWVPYWDLVNKERSIKFCDKFFDNIRKQNSEWKKNNFIIKKITPFFAVRFDDDSRMALTICKDYKTEGDRSQEALYKYYSVLEDLYKNKLINEINSGRLRLAAEGEYGLNLTDSLTFPKITTTPKEFKQGDRAIHWITSTDELGRTYISRVTEVIVENPDKNALMVSFEKKNIHRGIYSPDMITQHFKSGDPLIEILPHNLWARDQVQEMFMNGIRMVCIPRCCGTGKSYIALGFTYLYSRVLIVTSKNAIKDQFKDVIGNRATFITYQSLKNPNQLIGYDLIIFDECHHLEAPEWKDWSLSLISCNPDSKILGLTATPDRNDGINIIDSFFGGNHAADLTLPEAWSCGLLTIPIYVCGSYIEKNSDIEELVEMVEKSNVPEENKREAGASIDKLNKIRVDWTNSGGVSGTLNKYLPSWAEKVIVFCENIDQLKKQKDTIESWFLAIGRRPTMLEIHSKNSRKTNLYNITEFRRPVKNGEIKVILSVDMFGEGIHEQGIDALIFLRKTSSNIVYLQHIGRCLSVRSDGRKPVVFDLVGNIYNIDFGGIIRYKNELDEIENKKIAAGEKKEEERKTIEIQGDIISQIELISRIKELCSPVLYYLELLEQLRINNWEGFDDLENKRNVYDFIYRHCTDNSFGCKVFEIADEAKLMLIDEKSLLYWAEKMIQNDDFSDLIGLDRQSNKYRWFTRQYTKSNREKSKYTVDVKKYIYDKWKELNPDIKYTPRTKNEKLDLIKEMNSTGDYSKVSGKYLTDRPLYSFMLDNRDTILECNIAYNNIKNLNPGNINLEKAKDIIDRQAWDEAKDGKSSLYRWVTSHRRGGRCGYIEEAEIIWQHIKNLNPGNINLEKAKDIIDRQAWDEARWINDNSFYSWVTSHTKEGRRWYIEEAEIIWQHIKK